MLENCLDMIAGGPTVAQYQTAHSALSVIDKYEMIDTVPRSVVDYLSHEAKKSEAIKEIDVDIFDDHAVGSAFPLGAPTRTNKEDEIFSNVKNFLIGKEIEKKCRKR